MKMKAKQNKVKQKSSKPLAVESQDNSTPKYSNEEISSAITLASIMANDCFDETVTQVIDIVNVSDTSGIDSKETATGSVSEVQALQSKISEESIEIIPKQKTVDSQIKQTSPSYSALPVNVSQTPISGNPYPYGNYYSYYPMDPYGYYSQYQYYPMISMPPNVPPLTSRQCPYCSMVSPPISSVSAHSSLPVPFNMSAEPPKKMQEPIVVNSIAVTQPQVMSTQVAVSSLYPYYQNGPKVTSACVSSSEAQ